MTGWGTQCQRAPPHCNPSGSPHILSRLTATVPSIASHVLAGGVLQMSSGRPRKAPRHDCAWSLRMSCRMDAASLRSSAAPAAPSPVSTAASSASLRWAMSSIFWSTCSASSSNRSPPPDHVSTLSKCCLCALGRARLHLLREVRCMGLTRTPSREKAVNDDDLRNPVPFFLATSTPLALRRIGLTNDAHSMRANISVPDSETGIYGASRIYHSGSSQ